MEEKREKKHIASQAAKSRDLAISNEGKKETRKP